MPLKKRELFPEKLWDLVNKPTSGIKWSTDGRKIEVERSQLEKFLLYKFRSHNFDSFIRQLHFYGFKKTGNSYYHDKFQRGQPEALATMRRKYSNASASPLSASLSSSSLSTLTSTSSTKSARSARTRPTESVTDMNSKDITIYTMKPGPSEDVTFEDIREDIVQAKIDDTSIQVPMPKMDDDVSLRPKTLILDRYTYRNQTIFSAYFVCTGQL